MDTTYRCEIKTGDRAKSGTDARVCIQLIGANGLTGEIQLDHQNYDDFRKGVVDSFEWIGRDIGWVNSIRLFHDNSGDGPGWYVDYVKLGYKNLGLEVESNFYRWLAHTEGDGQIDVTKPVNVGNVSLESGVLRKNYLGFDFRRKKNEGPEAAHYVESFAYEYSEGFGLSLSKSKTVSGSASLSGEFFGIGSSFEIEVTTQSTKSLSCNAQQTFRTDIELSGDLSPGGSRTIVLLWYQISLEGSALCCGIQSPFSQKFAVNYDVIIFDGWLSDANIEKKVAEILSISLRTTVEQHQASKKMAVPVLERKIEGSISASGVSRAVRGIPQNVIRPQIFRDFPGWQLQQASGRRIKPI